MPIFDERTKPATTQHCSLWQRDELNANDGKKQHQCGVEIKLEVLVRDGSVLGGEGRGGEGKERGREGERGGEGKGRGGEERGKLEWGG